MSSTDLSLKQIELLKKLVEASQSDDDHTSDFLVVETMGTPPGAIFFNNNRVSPVARADLSELEESGYVRITEHNRQGEPLYSVTNRGIKLVQNEFQVLPVVIENRQPPEINQFDSAE